MGGWAYVCAIAVGLCACAPAAPEPRGEDAGGSVEAGREADRGAPAALDAGPAPDAVLHFGEPEDPAFQVAPGGEFVQCLTVSAPFPRAAFLGRVRFDFGRALHHLGLYAQAQDAAPAQHPQPCESVGGTYLFNALTPHDSFAFEPGTALRLESLPITIQAHVLNGTEEPLDASGTIELFEASEATFIVGPLQLTGALSQIVPPHSRKTVSAVCGPAFPMRIISLVGHGHAHNTAIRAWRTTATTREAVYESHSWAEPAVDRYSDLRLDKASALTWECDVDNTLDTPIAFGGNRIQTEEMCNLFGFFGPFAGQPWQCGSQ